MLDTAMGSTGRTLPQKIRDNWLVLTILTLTLSATFAGYLFEKNNNDKRNQARFEQASLAFEKTLTSTLTAYSQFLNGGVALFQSSENVTRDAWRVYVETLSMEENYPGIQAVSFNAIVRGADNMRAFEQRVQQTDWANFEVRPAGDRDMYTLVLYAEPQNRANESVIGFDVYSEASRAAAIDKAIATGEPSLTAPITLVQEAIAGNDGETQAGVLIFLPIYQRSEDSDGLAVMLPDAMGLIVSVFRMGDLVENVLRTADVNVAEQLNISLSDAPSNGPEAILYQSPSLSSAQAGEQAYGVEKTINLFGRSWVFRTTSTQRFETETARNSHNIILALGVLISLLVASLARAEVLRSSAIRESAIALSESKTRVEVLLREVNHRSKNMLALVQAIARQTHYDNPEDFRTSFSKRLSSLAASQDLLVRNEWSHISLRDLVQSQLSHFADLIGTRIKFSGDDVDLSSGPAQTIGMALHELATNAGKYGALSSETGKIDITWGIEANAEGVETFKMLWLESGGPIVATPERSGFGSKVTVSMVRLSLSGEVNADFEPTGFRWSLTCPAEKLRSGQKTVSR